MRIKQIKLENLGRFRSLEIDFSPTPATQSNVTVLIGINGAGKTSILKALATSLSWFVARVRSENATGSPISENLILNGAPSAAITLAIHDQLDFQWTLVKARAGRKGEHISQLHDATRFAEKYRRRLTADETSSLPLIAFYPVERSVVDIPLKIREKHSFLQLDGYDNSLNQGVDFRRFFEWFREREDIENEVFKPAAFLKVMNSDPDKFSKLINSIDNASERVDNLKIDDWTALKSELNEVGKAIEFMQHVEASSKDSQLSAVRTAIENFMPGFSNLKVQRKPRLHMSIQKNGEKLNVAQLSQGETSLMALVGDIARRLAMMNPELKNPLHGKGVVLIDEVDMHLHPQWARTLIERLTSTFPNCQFVLSTHSPLVISDCKGILVYALDNGQLTQVPSQYGQDVNTVLLDVMDTHIRNDVVGTQLNDLLDLIQDHKLEDAKALLSKMEIELPGQNIELAKAKLLLRKEELRRAEN